ncbi:pantoate--beta-alanine ligase [Oceanobacter mangrovi]|uniref:pantoate--beta-alanine ligase n=1 Tax=Oceanobacter mangrovi TaxID=2862510 RepID=UPI001C8EEC4A|nr:pantoate--beta-alanine ligase [Oceanobacter mangrovi]
MKTIHSVASLRAEIRAARLAGKDIGFVPTMGNLHEGHISLISAAKQQQCFTVASIFVNPLQFNDADDLARYPRTLDEDKEKLFSAGCDLLFAPDVEEMYPNGQHRQTTVHVPHVSEGLCGGSRPGHFDGVATVVTKLFNMVQPDLAFFGEKDFQQVAVIRKMVEDLNMHLEIVAVPTARAADGLALSSRNGYLSEEQRIQASALYQALKSITDGLQQRKLISELLKHATESLTDAGFTPDYLEVRHADDLSLIDDSALETGERIVVLGAAWLGKARLIDNISVTLNRHID